MRLLQYGPDPRQAVCCYREGSVGCAPLFFIHGGAWRDENNTFRDGDTFNELLDSQVPFYSVDYRLSPRVKYPAHNEDSVAGIVAASRECGATKIKLAGHSVGATIILGILPALAARGIEVQDVFLLDGIYDLADLVEEYGHSYEEFVANAHDDYRKVVIDLDIDPRVKVHVIHSYEDELLTTRQTQWLVSQLIHHSKPFSLHIANFGQHEFVYKNKEVVQLVNNTY